MVFANMLQGRVSWWSQLFLAMGSLGVHLDGSHDPCHVLRQHLQLCIQACSLDNKAADRMHLPLSSYEGMLHGNACAELACPL